MFGHSKPSKLEIDASFVDRLNHLATRVDKLEMESADRQLTVLKTVEKVLYQLRARTAKRAQSTEDDVGEEIEPEAGSYGPRSVPGTAHLARRFRGV